MNRVAKIGIDDMEAICKKIVDLISKIDPRSLQLLQQTTSLEQVPARVITQPESGRVNPFTQSTVSINKLVDKYIQPINVLATKSTMAVKSSVKEMKEANDIYDKINYIIQQSYQLGNEGISSSISSLNLSIKKSYQTIDLFKKNVDSLIKKEPSQDVLNHVNTLTSTIQDEKTNIIEHKKTLSNILISLFELPSTTINSLQKDKIFANQFHVVTDELKGKISQAQKNYNELNNQFIKYKSEAVSIRDKFNLSWKNKEENLSDLADNIKSLAALKNEKVMPLQQQIKESLDPIGHGAINSHIALIKEIESRLQGTLEETERDELTHLKNDSEQKFTAVANLQQEYQLNMPNNKFLSEGFSKKQKETNARLGQIMLEIHTFAEHQEKQLKKLNG